MKMRKRFKSCLCAVLILFSLSACDVKPVYREPSGANRVYIVYGMQSFTKNIPRGEDIDTLVAQFSGLALEETGDSMDLSTLMTVIFYKDEKELVAFSVDGGGIVNINNGIKAFHITSPSFNYATVFEIYEKGDEKGSE